MVVMTLYGVRICSSLPVFPGRESELFYNDSSESPRDHSFPAMCSSEMSSAACVGSVGSRKGTAAGPLQLRWLRNLEMWVKTVSAAVIFDPLLQGGGGSRRLQVWGVGHTSKPADGGTDKLQTLYGAKWPAGSLRGLLPPAR